MMDHVGKVRNTARVLVTGAGGFIGHHLVSSLRAQGYWVRGVDLKHPEFCATNASEFQILDLRRWQDCLLATAGDRRGICISGRHGRDGVHFI